MNRLVYILLVALMLTGINMYWLYNRYQKLTAEYSNSVENNKAYEAELNNETRMFKLTIDELNTSKDSIVINLNELREELGIKDKRIKQLQYKNTTVIKHDTLFFRDTIFSKPTFQLDTIVGDKWVQTKLYLKYPNIIGITPKVELENYIFIKTKRETIRPRKKFFLLRWFQKKMTVITVTVKENNPYVKNKKSRYVQIIK